MLMMILTFKFFTFFFLCLLQSLYRFLDPKFKTFYRLFSKTIISFSRLKVIKWPIYRDLKKRRRKAFFMMRSKQTGKNE